MKPLWNFQQLRVKPWNPLTRKREVNSSNRAPVEMIGPSYTELNDHIPFTSCCFMFQRHLAALSFISCLHFLKRSLIIRTTTLFTFINHCFMCNFAFGLFFSFFCTFMKVWKKKTKLQCLLLSVQYFAMNNKERSRNKVHPVNIDFQMAIKDWKTNYIFSVVVVAAANDRIC